MADNLGWVILILAFVALSLLTFITIDEIRAQNTCTEHGYRYKTNAGRWAICEDADHVPVVIQIGRPANGGS